jgi:NitT/TauT family transport system substrate-binding protein
MPATLNALSKGQKLKAFYQYSTGTIFFLKVPKAGPIQSVPDLQGKVIGISEPGGGEVPMIKAALKGAGLDPDKDVRLIPIGEGSSATFDALKNGRVDAYSSNFADTLAVELAGIPLRDITPAEFNAFPAQMMLTTPESLEKKTVLR